MLRPLSVLCLLPLLLLATPASALTKAQKMETCEFGAKDQKLEGAKRKAFINKCMSNRNDKRGATMKLPAKKPAAKKTMGKKPVANKTTIKTMVKKPVAKKTVAKKTMAKKPMAKDPAAQPPAEPAPAAPK
jgi:psiF repeat